MDYKGGYIGPFGLITLFPPRREVRKGYRSLGHNRQPAAWCHQRGCGTGAPAEETGWRAARGQSASQSALSATVRLFTRRQVDRRREKKSKHAIGVGERRQDTDKMLARPYRA
jgi:hypothetical protein